MQLFACVLLLFITTDKTLALSHQDCGGNVQLDQESAGRINLTLPGVFIGGLDAVNGPPDPTLQVSVCTWTIDVPTGKTVLLKLEWAGSGSSISVHCEKTQVLESGGSAVLSGCDRNEAKLTWTGVGHSSNVVQLAYYVQEDERNSLDGNSTHQPVQDPAPWAETGTSFPSVASVRHETSSGTDGAAGHPCEGPESSSGTPCPSSVSTRDREPLLPTSAQQGPPVAGRADRETLPLPEEKANNGADTSGHLTDAPVAASERTHPDFLPEVNTGVNSASPGSLIPSSQTASRPNTLFHTDGRTSKHTYGDMTTQNDHSATSSDLPPSEKALVRTEERDTIGFPQDVPVLGTERDKPPHSWRSLRNTDKAISDLTSATASSPLKSSPEPLRDEPSNLGTYAHPTFPFEAASRTHSPTAHATEPSTAVPTTEASSDHTNISPSDSFLSAASETTVLTPALTPSEKIGISEGLHGLIVSSESQTDAPQSTESVTRSPQMSHDETEGALKNFVSASRAPYTIAPSPDGDLDGRQTSAVTASVSTTRATPTINSVAQGSETTKEAFILHSTHTLVRETSSTHSPTPVTLSLTSSSPASNTYQTHAWISDSSHTTTSSSVDDFATHTAFVEHKNTPVPPQTSHSPQTHHQISPAHEPSLSVDTTTHASLLSLTTVKGDHGTGEMNVDKETEMWQRTSSSTTWQTPTAGPPEPPALQTTPRPGKRNHSAPSSSTLSSTVTWSSTKTPKYYIVPDQPVAIRVESIKLLLQIVVEESKSASTVGLEEDTGAWMEPYLQRAPGFSRLLGVWSSGHAVQSLLLFKTSGALQWLSMSGPTSLLERTGLAQALRDGRTFRSSRITNITVGGLQSDVCSWLLQCPAGYLCLSQPNTANYSCSSVCHLDHCHHHGICTHHPGQLPVCRCLVGDSFWYMGKRCDTRMTRARLVGACLAVFIIIVMVVCGLAFVAVRRYRAILIQAKVDQTRSSYRRFNHFDELSGRFWLRSWAGSADSLDNPAFTRSDELLHLRALDRPCCYHDDTLSLASTCPSHGTRINTIYPHSSQYGWRGSEMSMGDGVLDSGKASDLSVCSWPVEPIHWTPFPLLQQLASHRTPTVRVSRPRSYCEGMELVDLGRSWTA